MHDILDYIRARWGKILFISGILIFVYYPLALILSDDIDHNTSLEIKTDDHRQSLTLETVSFIINREVNEKYWTPNAPFFFPSHFLDNMPNFQLGMIAPLSTVTNAVNKCITEKDALKEAAELLKYPGTILAFSPNDKMTPAPSANTQYRKARKQINKFNAILVLQPEIYPKSPKNLALILQAVNKDLNKSINEIEQQVREHSSDNFDFKADDIFYYNQGKTYSYYFLLKALGDDYKEIIVSNNLYSQWIKMLKSLELGAKIDPNFVRNGALSGSFSPNHLQYLYSYIARSQLPLQKIISELK